MHPQGHRHGHSTPPPSQAHAVKKRAEGRHLIDGSSANTIDNGQRGWGTNDKCDNDFFPEFCKGTLHLAETRLEGDVRRQDEAPLTAPQPTSHADTRRATVGGAPRHGPHDARQQSCTSTEQVRGTSIRCVIPRMSW